MLIVKNGLLLNQQASFNNTSLILTNGIIQDTNKNIIYSVIDVSINKPLNGTYYVYYNVASRKFIIDQDEYNINNIDVTHPNICPILKIVTDNLNVTSFSYWDTTELQFDPSDYTGYIDIPNATTITHEVVVMANDIFVSKTVLGIVNIYVVDEGDLLLSNVLEISNKKITILQQFDGKQAIISYLTPR